MSKRFVLVTGACGGLGTAVVKAAAEAGFAVIAADINACEGGENVFPLVIDVTSEACVAEAAEEVGKITQELYAIVHLAGAFAMDSFVEIPEAELEKMLQVNLMGVYRVNKAFLPFLQKRLASGQAPAPRILIVTSELAAFAPLPFNGIYGMTKTALDSYSCSLAMELELLGIRVVTLRPGAFGEGMPRASVKEMERMSAASRLYPEVAAKFRSIVLSETGSAKDPALFACRVVKLLEKKRPAFVYRQNNSIKLKLFSLLPVGLRAALLKKLLS